MEIISRRDINFLLYDWLNVESLPGHPRFDGQTRDDYDAFMDLGERLAVNEFLPCYKASDQTEPELSADGGVRIQPGVVNAVRAYLDAGMQLASVDERHGGMQFPTTVSTAVMANIMGANIAASGFLMLSTANARVISEFGNERQIERFAAPQHAGDTLGTMCLSEPDVGSSLGDITTRARRESEDELGSRFRIFGRKMWISGGGQDITEDIVHLVLAKIVNEDGTLPAGTRGISLFIVPKRLPPEADPGRGSNDVTVAGLNHKMGYRGISNCLLNFGEGVHASPLGEPGAIGYLLGEPGQGLRIMFQMMNEARINVGLGAAALAYRGYTLSRDYAKDRVQGRPLADKKAPRPVPIIRHPDVRRMVLAQKAIAEGGLALCLYSAQLFDLTQAAEDPARRARAQSLLDLLTPVTKSWPSEQGLRANQMAIQIHGGYGYTRDFDVEQLYRDNRLNPIHEGTTGIQAIDLLGRKLLFDGLKSLASLTETVQESVEAARSLSPLAGFAAALDQIRSEIERVITEAAGRGDAPSELANATPFLHAFGHFIVAWIWLDLARAALRAKAGGTDPGVCDGKIWCCRYFFEHEVPRISGWLAPLAQRSRVTEEVPESLL